jgi:SAM-dependent methyltransferase
MEHNWDEELQFLINVRKDWCNSDYVEFLIDKVWRITKPINIVDFGCGYGYLCDLLMPLLPKGSTYTGIDKSKKLLNFAEKHLSSYSFDVELMCADLNEYMPIKKYDLAISQAVLRHIPQPMNILKKMIDSVVDDGWIICFEGDRPIEDAGFYSSDIDYRDMSQSFLFQKKWSYEYNNGGRDYRTGFKIPQYMQQIGLKNIGVRMNDAVKFINPMDSEYESKFDAFVEHKGYYSVSNNNENKIFRTSEGLTLSEQQEFNQNEKDIAETILKNKGKGFILQAPCTLISYGKK